MRLKSSLLALLLWAGVAHCGTTTEIAQEALDTSGKISTVNENFRGLANNKLDLYPRGVLPFTDSRYNLGASGREWLRLYVDGITVSTITASSATITNLTVTNVTASTVTTTNLVLGGSSFTGATQAQQETGSSTTTYTSPGRQQYHPSASKAWVVFRGTGTVTVLASYNVSSITDNGVGDYTINFTTSFSTAFYVANLTAQSTTAPESGTYLICQGKKNTTPTASAFNMTVVYEAFIATDVSRIYATFYGDQ
jgi:hypothetical protein